MEGKNGEGGQRGCCILPDFFRRTVLVVQGGDTGGVWVGRWVVVLWMGGRYSSEVSRAEGLGLYDGGCGLDLCMDISGRGFVGLV